MNRKEFLEQLQIALSGEVPQREVMSQLDYYDRYIRQESIHKNEETIVAELGSPHLIAKTIIDAYERAYGKTYTSGSNSEYQQSWDCFKKDTEDSRNFNKKSSKQSIFNIPWYIKILLLFIILILLLPIIIIGGVVLKIILSLLPIILIILLFIAIIKLIQK